MALYAIGGQMQSLTRKIPSDPDITSYLKAVENDILDNLVQFARRGGVEQQQQLPFAMPWMKEEPYKKYEVNVVIDNSETKGAPVSRGNQPHLP